MNAILPNYHHYLDGILCMKVIEKTLQHKINILSVHDCYYVNVINIEIIKNIYRNQFINILVKDILKIVIDNYINELKLNIKFLRFIRYVKLDKDWLEKPLKIKSIKGDLELNKIRFYILKLHKIYNNIKDNREVSYDILQKYILEDLKSKGAPI